jgi:hypothetical protein
MRCLRFESRRYRSRLDSKRVQKPFERLLWCHWRAWRVAGQVDVQLTIGKALTNLMRPMNRQRCLADASCPSDYDNGRVSGKEGVQRFELKIATGEPWHVSRELMWCDSY